MATVRLGRYEVEEYELPPVCARCGARAVTSPPKRFAWHPGWVTALLVVSLLMGVLILVAYVVVAVAVTKRMTVPLPLCRRHRNYWRNRALFTYGGLALIVFLIVGGLVAVAVFDDGSGGSPYAAVLLGGLLVFVVWLLAAAVMQGTGIRPGQITDRGIELIGVSRDFAEAVREERRGDEEEEEDDRPRRRRDEDSDRDRERVRRRDEDDARPRRRRADDEDEGDSDHITRRRRRQEPEDER
jgi:hypothetical protein